MQGGKSGVWLGLVGCCATCSPMHPGQMSIFPTPNAISRCAGNRWMQQAKRAKIEPKGINPTAAYNGSDETGRSGPLGGHPRRHDQHRNGEGIHRGNGRSVVQSLQRFPSAQAYRMRLFSLEAFPRGDSSGKRPPSEPFGCQLGSRRPLPADRGHSLGIRIQYSERRSLHHQKARSPPTPRRAVSARFPAASPYRKTAYRRGCLSRRHRQAYRHRSVARGNHPAIRAMPRMSGGPKPGFRDGWRMPSARMKPRGRTTSLPCIWRWTNPSPK